MRRTRPRARHGWIQPAIRRLGLGVADVATLATHGCVTRAVYDQALHQLDETRQERRQVAEQNTFLTRELANRYQELEVLKHRLDELASRGQLQSQDVNRLAQRNLELSSQVADLTRQKQDISQQLSDQSDDVANLKRRLETSTKTNREITEANERLRKEIGALTVLGLRLSERVHGMATETAGVSERLARLEAQGQERDGRERAVFERLRSVSTAVNDALTAEIDQGDVSLIQAGDRLVVALAERLLYGASATELRAPGQKALTRLGKALDGMADLTLRVEGYTDDVPVGPKLADRFGSNWELSTARATTVVRYLIDHVGLPAAQLYAAGYAENRPVASNDTPEGRTRNRRIELVLLPNPSTRGAAETAAAPENEAAHGNPTQTGSPEIGVPKRVAPADAAPKERPDPPGP